MNEAEKRYYKRCGGEAFPTPMNESSMSDCKGMSLRDWFAGQALASMVNFSTTDVPKICFIAYEIADGMLAERENVAEV